MGYLRFFLGAVAALIAIHIILSLGCLAHLVLTIIGV